MKVILAHSLTLHDWVCIACPSAEQSAPPYAGAGFVHVLVRTWVPSPQFAEQMPYSVQAVYPPSTVRNIIWKKLCRTLYVQQVLIMKLKFLIRRPFESHHWHKVGKMDNTGKSILLINQQDRIVQANLSCHAIFISHQIIRSKGLTTRS